MGKINVYKIENVCGIHFEEDAGNFIGEVATNIFSKLETVVFGPDVSFELLVKRNDKGKITLEVTERTI